MTQYSYSKRPLLPALLLTALMTLAGSSCKSPYDRDYELDQFEVEYKDRDIISADQSGIEKDIHIITTLSQDKWTASTKSEWITLTSSADKVHVSVAPYSDFGARKGVIVIAYGHFSYSIQVEQTAGKQVDIQVLGTPESKQFYKTLPSKGGEVSVTVKSNTPITDVIIPDSCAWLTIKEKTVAGDETTFKISVPSSESVRDRFGTVYLYTSADISKVSSFAIKQLKRNYVRVPLSVDMVSTNAQEPNEGPIANLVNGNTNDYFHTIWSGSSPGGKPHHIAFALDTPIEDLKIEYSSRPNGDGGGDVKIADIYTSEVGGTDDANWTKVGTMTFPLPGGRKARVSSNERIQFDHPVKFIRFVPTARRNANPIDPSGSNGWFNMGEIYLWTSE